MRSRADISAGGSQIATPEDARRVLLALLRHVGRENAVRAADLAVEAGVPGRTCRAAYSAEDGVSLVLGRSAGGLFVASTREEAAGFTAELRSRAIDELARAARRDAFLDALEAPTQLELFGEMRESA